jgi:hypothetical protein
MRLAQGRFWRASSSRGSGQVSLELMKGTLPVDLADLRQLEIDIPLAKWSLVVKNARFDRKLLGGLLLDFARQKDRVGSALSSDLLYIELQRTLLDATASLIEEGFLVLGVAEEGER